MKKIVFLIIGLIIAGLAIAILLDETSEKTLFARYRSALASVYYAEKALYAKRTQRSVRWYLEAEDRFYRAELKYGKIRYIYNKNDYTLSDETIKDFKNLGYFIEKEVRWSWFSRTAYQKYSPMEFGKIVETGTFEYKDGQELKKIKYIVFYREIGDYEITGWLERNMDIEPFIKNRNICRIYADSKPFMVVEGSAGEMQARSIQNYYRKFKKKYFKGLTSAEKLKYKVYKSVYDDSIPSIPEKKRNKTFLERYRKAYYRMLCLHEAEHYREIEHSITNTEFRPYLSQVINGNPYLAIDNILNSIDTSSMEEHRVMVRHIISEYKEYGYPKEKLYMASADELIRVAKIIYAQKYVIKSIKAIKIIVSFTGKSYDYYKLGNAYNQKSDYRKAIQNYTKIIEIISENAYLHNIRGSAYFRNGEYEKAIQDYDEAIKYDPEGEAGTHNKGGVFFNRGLAYAALGKYDKAIPDYTRALKLNPKYAETYFRRGLSYHFTGEYQKAIDDYTKLTELDTKYTVAYYNLACAYFLKGEKDKALSNLEEATNTDKQYKEMAKKDKDFKDLWDDPDFKKLVE